MEQPVIKMSYRELSQLTSNPVSPLGKLSNTPTHNVKASHIRRLLKLTMIAHSVLVDEHKKLVEEFGKKGEDGNLVMMPEDPQRFQIKEGVEKDFEKAMQAFDDKIAEIKEKPLNADTLSDIRMSAKEIELLGPLYTDEGGAGPGVPNFPQGLSPVR